MADLLLRTLDRLAQQGRRAELWWRDDDATKPTAPLDQLLALSNDWGVPVTLAVIPAATGPALAERLEALLAVNVAVHGWSHENHAGPGEKKQELGAQRPAQAVLETLARGLHRLNSLYGDQLLPVLVPPWNRIAPAVVDGLPALGFRALSTYGAARPAPLAVVNTHVDLMDWHGTGACHPAEKLLADLARALDTHPGPIGILSHHLVHDPAAWAFLARLFALTRDHPGCRWTPLSAHLPASGPAAVKAMDRK